MDSGSIVQCLAFTAPGSELRALRGLRTQHARLDVQGSRFRSAGRRGHGAERGCGHTSSPADFQAASDNL